MAKMIVHKNELTKYFELELEKLNVLTDYLECGYASKYIKRGYLYIPQGEYTNDHLETVLNLLKQYENCEKSRRKDVCLSVLEVNV